MFDELEEKLRKEQEDSEKLAEAAVKGLLENAATEKPELEKPILLQAAAIKLKSNCVRPPHPKGWGMLRAARSVSRSQKSSIIL